MVTTVRSLRGLLGALAAVAVLVVMAPSAQAHSETIRSDPPNGGMVPVGRSSLTLWFDEPIGAAASTIELRTLDGLPVKSSFDISNGDLSVVVETAPLEHGSYVLDWHALVAGGRARLVRHHRVRCRSAAGCRGR